MKKTSLFLLLVFFIIHTINLNAQAVKLGIRGGINISDLSFDPDVNTIFPGMSKSGTTVFLAGGILQFSIAGPFSLLIEPTYINKGAKIEGNNVGFNISGGLASAYVKKSAGTEGRNPAFHINSRQAISIDKITVTYKLEYLEIPVLLHVNIPLPAIQPFVEAGPTVGFNLSSSYTTEFTYMGQSFSDNTNNKDNTASTEFGLIFGAGVEYNVIPLITLMFNGRYSLGLTELSKNQTSTDQQQTTNPKIKSTGIQFSVGILFGL